VNSGNRSRIEEPPPATPIGCPRPCHSPVLASVRALFAARTSWTNSDL
jgi:hypothetical protein